MDLATIEKRARQALRKAGIDGPPVDVRKVAASLGIRVERTDLGEDCSGVLVRDGDRAVIGVNRDHHRNRQRFTAAHEFGHFLLHEGDTYVDSGFRVNFRDLESGSGTKRQEVEANAFAAALLMPEAWVKAAFRERSFELDGDDDDLGTLAKQFGVSAQAMAIRLATLGLGAFQAGGGRSRGGAG